LAGITVKSIAEHDFLRRKLTRTDSRSPDRRVEVVVTHAENGKRQVLVQDLTYGAGVGWFVQKTIELDPDQVDALLRALCTARSPCFEGKRGFEGKHSPGFAGLAVPVEAPRKIATASGTQAARAEPQGEGAQIIDLSPKL
jgi:hypothetical protein